MSPKKPILLVEDDDIDAMTMKRSFKELNIVNPLVRVENGEEALEFLQDEKNEKPGVILLDLNMPRMNGIEFLKVIKGDLDLRQIPVVILTTSKEDQDKIESFKLSAAGYMIKPVDYMKFIEVTRTIHLYWLLSETAPLKY